MWWLVGIMLAAGLVQYLPFQSVNNFFHFSALFAIGGVTLYRQQERIGQGLFLGLLILFTSMAYVEIELWQALIGLGTALAIYYVKWENGFTRFLGDISYSFYLIHAVIGTTCEFVFIKFFPLNSPAVRIALQGVCLGVAIASAYVFYLLVERPFMRLASHLRA